jgi:hypothetical protein
LVLLLYFSFRIPYIGAHTKVYTAAYMFSRWVAGCLIEIYHLCGVQCAVRIKRAAVVRKSVQAFGGNVNLSRVSVATAAAAAVVET